MTHPSDAGPPVRVGIVGSGLMGAMHSEAFRRAELLPSEHRRFALRRVASRNGATGAALAARYGWAASTTDWRAVTRADDVDLVDVCTPEDSHAEIALDALAHGKHVLCEKPLAVTGADALEMWRAAEAAGRVHVAGFPLRQWPALRSARALVESGRLGAVRSVRAQYLIDSRTLLESALRGLGSHLLDAAMFLAGPVTSVSASSRPVAEDPSVDAAVSALLRFETGAGGMLTADREARGRPMEVALGIDCEHGAIELSWSRRDVLEVVSPDGDAGLPRRASVTPEEALPTVPFPGAGFGVADLFVAQARAVAALLSGAPAVHADFGDGHRVAAVSDAIREAWESGRRAPVATGGGRASNEEA